MVGDSRRWDDTAAWSDDSITIAGKNHFVFGGFTNTFTITHFGKRLLQDVRECNEGIAVSYISLRSSHSALRRTGVAIPSNYSTNPFGNARETYVHSYSKAVEVMQRGLMAFARSATATARGRVLRIKETAI